MRLKSIEGAKKLKLKVKVEIKKLKLKSITPRRRLKKAFWWIKRNSDQGATAADKKRCNDIKQKKWRQDSKHKKGATASQNQRLIPRASKIKTRSCHLIFLLFLLVGVPHKGIVCRRTPIVAWFFSRGFFLLLYYWSIFFFYFFLSCLYFALSCPLFLLFPSLFTVLTTTSVSNVFASFWTRI